MLEVAYFGALRVSELVSLTWSQIIPRDSGETQLAIVGEGLQTAPRPVADPATSAHWLRHAHASHALDNGAPIQLVSQTLGHVDQDDERLCSCEAE